MHSMGLYEIVSNVPRQNAEKIDMVGPEVCHVQASNLVTSQVAGSQSIRMNSVQVPDTGSGFGISNYGRKARQ